MRTRRSLLMGLFAVLGLLLLPQCGRKTPVKPPGLAAPEAIDDLVAINVKEGIRLTWRRPTH
jgi:hypothetical protein